MTSLVTNSIASESIAPQFKRRELFQTVLFNFGLCTVIGLIVTAISGRFWTNQLFSHCIGWTVFGIIEIWRRIQWPDREISVRGWLLLGTIGPAIGVILGGSLALLILGQPLSRVIKTSWFTEWPTIVISLIATVVASSFGVYRTRKLKEEIATANLLASAERDQRELADAQLNIVRTQVEPHMLFNTLANLRALITLDPAKAVKMLDHFNDYLRTSLTNSRQSEIKLIDEFKLLENYLEIMQIRMGERMTYRLQLDPMLAQTKVPTWILQPLVENAIKYGLEPSIDGGTLSVLAEPVATSGIRIIVDNSGEPLPENFSLQALMPSQAGGLGLYQSYMRIKRLYGDAGNFTITRGANNRGATVAITIES